MGETSPNGDILRLAAVDMVTWVNYGDLENIRDVDLLTII